MTACRHLQVLLSCWPFVCVCAQVKLDFHDLLSDQHIEVGQRWSKVKERLETDPRYKAVESSALREELFKQYMEKQAKVWAALFLVSDGFDMYVLVTSDLLHHSCETPLFTSVSVAISQTNFFYMNLWIASVWVTKQF